MPHLEMERTQLTGFRQLLVVGRGTQKTLKNSAGNPSGLGNFPVAFIWLGLFLLELVAFLVSPPSLGEKLGWEGSRKVWIVFSSPSDWKE